MTPDVIPFSANGYIRPQSVSPLNARVGQERERAVEQWSSDQLTDAMLCMEWGMRCKWEGREDHRKKTRASLCRMLAGRSTFETLGDKVDLAFPNYCNVVSHLHAVPSSPRPWDLDQDRARSRSGTEEIASPPVLSALGQDVK